MVTPANFCADDASYDAAIAEMRACGINVAENSCVDFVTWAFGEGKTAINIGDAAMDAGCQLSGYTPPAAGGGGGGGSGMGGSRSSISISAGTAETFSINSGGGSLQPGYGIRGAYRCQLSPNLTAFAGLDIVRYSEKKDGGEDGDGTINAPSKTVWGDVLLGIDGEMRPGKFLLGLGVGAKYFVAGPSDIGAFDDVEDEDYAPGENWFNELDKSWGIFAAVSVFYFVDNNVALGITGESTYLPVKDFKENGMDYTMDNGSYILQGGLKYYF